ncbi:IS110 family transposase [Salmonella bongori]|uniref:IS110 family transposase n=2 Tax=Salmonella bongori TaxID=54736 RepID=UPI0009AA78FD|nr:IS110 family transposase [Salmonella bongori]EGE4656962.1 IS110 family transposase [Salmonella bongori serovar 40:z35:- str. 95-0123]QVP36407.1 IS110 family transposase [Salmonella bongori serovar 40:z35:-]QVP37100.1 IS110 family transposase [Salmonella bongori serovar 40:z35:-]QVP37150.1 IS110 family transposase [Salmonella bongori serovar 40:z35:-]QVP37200.1 IS110 family transposase [Salmonella bongori serovar 40:z35:-]
MNIKRIGLDLAKQIFQLHAVDHHERVVLRKTLRRSQMLTFFTRLEPCLIGIEACGSSHYWARELTRLGHIVRIIAPQFVKPYLRGNKNDANDAEAICEAVSRPGMRFVAVKSEAQQCMQAEHRVRARLIRDRTALSNEIRGMLGEFGLVLPVGLPALRRALPEILSQQEQWDNRFIRLLCELAEELQALDERLKRYDRRLKQLAQEEARIRRLQEVSGIGPVTASALVAAVGDAGQFKNGREMAAWLGLVPRQHSSGGKSRLGHISKRGDSYLRTLLIHGARAVLNACGHKEDRRSQWLKSVAERRNRNVATVAMANKNARIAWAILSREEEYRVM